MAVCGEGAQRAAVAAMCANGGFTVVLRMPGMAVSGSDAEQLGLATPQFQDVPVGPAVWRKAGSCKALMLAAAPITALMGEQGFASAESLFETAVGLVAGGVLYQIKASEPLTVAGAACAYRLTLQEPSWI